MKKIILITLLGLIFIQSGAQQVTENHSRYYYFGAQKIALQYSDQKIYLRLPASEAGAARIFLKNSFQISDKQISALQDERFMVIDMGEKNKAKLDIIVNHLKSSNRSELVSPVLTASDGKDVVVDEGFYVKLKPGNSFLQLSALAAQKNCSIDKAYTYNSSTYLLKAGISNNFNAIKMANEFYESGLFEYAEPDFRLLEGTTAVPNDPLFNLQWAALNTGAANQFNGTPGADIDLDEAWDISTGNASIKIAVIDEGVERTHPDLVNNISPLGFGLLAANATTGNILSSTRSHGTNCAGIIAAEANNNIGVAGVAPLSKIIPVNLTINTTGTFGTASQLAQCIDWSWNDAAADILSNSWGGGFASSLVHDAIIRAVTLGRGGKGAIVIFSTGNNNAGLHTPSAFPETIAVGAMSMCYQRKSGTSCDGETFWGGNYGTGLDISAPGVKIATTHNTGTGTASNPDYNLTFNGTSSATPFVAGVAALVLSINSNFTQQQVKEILEKSARKVGPYNYSFVQHQPNGSWTSELGHGMVNAKNALLLAQNPDLCNVLVTAPNSLQVCSGGNISLNIGNHVTGNTYQWRRDAVAVGTGTNFNANQTGNYDVILTTASGCKDTSYSFGVVVSSPEGALIADAGRDTSLCLNTKIFLGGGPSGAGGTGIIHPMRAISYDTYNNQLLRFDLMHPSGNFEIIKSDFIPGPLTNEFYCGAAATPYGLYMINRLSRMLVKVDTATGTTFPIGLTGITTFNGLTYDPVSQKIFAVSSGNGLYEINRHTGVATFIASITGAGTNALISLSTDNSGQLYGLRISPTVNISATIVRINKTTGAATLVGNTGFLANFAQSGEADPITDELYQVGSTSVLGSSASFNGKGLWIINKTTGLATLTGSVAEPWNQLDALSIAGKEYKYQWSPATNLSNPNDANPEFTATDAGSFTYTLTVTDLCGNTATDQVTIVVHPSPAVPVISPANPILSHRNGFRDTLTYTQQGGLNYVWMIGTSEQPNTSNIFPISFANSASSLFSVKTTDPVTGCSSIAPPVSFSYSTGVLMNNNTALTVCDSSFYDAGGPSGLTGNSFTRSFTPATPGSKLKLSIYNINLAQFATLYVYDGPTSGSPRIEALSSSMNGSTLREYVASNPDGILTIRFEIGSSQSSGWWAGLTCEESLQFRSISDGNWDDPAIWESKPAAATTWTAATRKPHKSDDLIEVRNTVTIDDPTQTDDVVITGKLRVIAPGNLNLYKVKPGSELFVQTGGSLDMLDGRQAFGGIIELKGNLENSGNITVEELIVNGTTPQQLTNSSGTITDINKLTMNNAAGLTISGMHDIANLDLINGLIHTSASNTICFDNLNGGSANSYVNGVVQFKGNASMDNQLIPIGKAGNYRPLLLSADNGGSEGDATMQAEVIMGAPPVRTFPAGIVNVSSVRYYQVSMIENPINLSGFNITLPYGTDDGVTNHATLKVAKDDGAGAWVDLGGTASGPAPGTIESIQFNSFSDFVLANLVGGTVPVTVVSFSGQLMQNKAKLQWVVQNEINFNHYEVERSVDGINFNYVGNVNALGSSGNIQYQFTDDNLPFSTVYYYRLKMINNDGTFSYSNSIILRNTTIAQSRILAIGPNPFTDKLTIQFESAVNEKIPAALYDSKGQLVKQWIFNANTGNNQFYIDGSELPAAVYMLRMQTGKQLITHKIVKQ